MHRQANPKTFYIQLTRENKADNLSVCRHIGSVGAPVVLYVFYSDEVWQTHIVANRYERHTWNQHWIYHPYIFYDIFFCHMIFYKTWMIRKSVTSVIFQLIDLKSLLSYISIETDFKCRELDSLVFISM